MNYVYGVACIVHIVIVRNQHYEMEIFHEARMRKVYNTFTCSLSLSLFLYNNSFKVYHSCSGKKTPSTYSRYLLSNK